MSARSYDKHMLGMWYCMRFKSHQCTHYAEIKQHHKISLHKVVGVELCGHKSLPILQKCYYFSS